MKKRLFAIPLALGMALGMAGCGSSSETTTKVETTTTETTTIAPTTTSTPKTYTIKVYDIDGEVIGDKTVDLNECPTVNDALDKYFDVKKSGTFITSINNSVVDSNWYLSILENGEYSMTGVDGLEANDGDVFEFKSECFKTVAFGGSFDEYDVLVDKFSAGAVVPIMNFGHLLVSGTSDGFKSSGVIGLFKGVFTNAGAGISVAILSGFIVSMIFKIRD